MFGGHSIDVWWIFDWISPDFLNIFHLQCISDGFVMDVRKIFDWCSLDVRAMFDRCSISHILFPICDFPLPIPYVCVPFRSSFAHFPLPMARPGGMRGAIESNWGVCRSSWTYFLQIYRNQSLEIKMKSFLWIFCCVGLVCGFFAPIIANIRCDDCKLTCDDCTQAN